MVNILVVLSPDRRGVSGYKYKNLTTFSGRFVAVTHLKARNVTSQTFVIDARHLTSESWDSLCLPAELEHPLRSQVLGESQFVVERAGFSSEWEVVFVNKLLFVAVVGASTLHHRLKECTTCYMAACSLFAVPGYGRKTTGDLNQDALSGILWAITVIIIIMLALCYRFMMWRVCCDTAHNYIPLSKSGTLNSTTTTVMTLEELVDDLTEKECPLMDHCTIQDAIQEKVYPEIDIRDFVGHVNLLKMNGDHGFYQEFSELAEACRSDSFLSENFNMDRNKHKNRYINIGAYDHSRVILKIDESSSDQSDYINANYVHGYNNQKIYIATQGPLTQTVPDFWQMVWQHNSNVIVMITNLTEKGRNKCEQYWPTNGEETYGHLTVRLLSTDSRAFYIIRVFLVGDLKDYPASSAAVRTVYHYHYTQWPDHGVPDYSLPVLSFVQKSAAQSGPENGPIIVHCSAGVGRTGTYILIDSMIAKILDKGSVNIPSFIRNIRQQRNFLVQTEEQYKFIHEVLLEYLLGNGTTDVSQDLMMDYVMQLELPFRSIFHPHISNTSLLEKHFQQITEYQPKQSELSVALEYINESKNKVAGLIPVNSSRVILPARPLVAGSDYINATFLQGYRKSAEYIVTQHPVQETVEDFWRMVWHVQSPVIVVLSSFRDEENKEFWPPAGTSTNLNAEGLCVTTKEECVSDHGRGVITLEVVVDLGENCTPLRTRVMILIDWPYHHRKLYRVFKPICDVQTFLAFLDCGPVTVVDRFGGVEAGTFCALWTLKDQLLSERCADFYQVCKLFHYKRPGIFRSQKNYLFLHHAMAALCERLQARSVANQGVQQHHNLSSADNTTTTVSHRLGHL